MKLSKKEREQVRLKFGGRCAYCGQQLGSRWHADHFEPIERKLLYVSGKGVVQTGECHRPERHRLDNMMPACPPCNIDKHIMSLEEWRRKLQDATNVLMRNNPTYRHALRFGLLAETGARIVFHFESLSHTTEGWPATASQTLVAASTDACTETSAF